MIKVSAGMICSFRGCPDGREDSTWLLARTFPPSPGWGSVLRGLNNGNVNGEFSKPEAIWPTCPDLVQISG